jgi:hypothetical protein
LFTGIDDRKTGAPMFGSKRRSLLFTLVAAAALAACNGSYPAPDDGAASSGSSQPSRIGWAGSSYSGPSAIYGPVRGSVP